MYKSDSTKVKQNLDSVDHGGIIINGAPQGGVGELTNSGGGDPLRTVHYIE